MAFQYSTDPTAENRFEGFPFGGESDTVLT